MTPPMPPSKSCVRMPMSLDDQRTYVEDATTPLSDHSIHYSIEIKPVP
jgi:hypothetical protein